MRIKIWIYWRRYIIDGEVLFIENYRVFWDLLCIVSRDVLVSVEWKFMGCYRSYRVGDRNCFLMEFLGKKSIIFEKMLFIF